MFRFVILHHVRAEPGASHYDWLFEIDGDGPLQTWAVDQAISAEHACDVPCRSLAPHRREYLNYEGPISGDRGVVSQWEVGTFGLLEQGPDFFRAALCGSRLSGRVEFVVCDQQWRLRWTPA
jgi:hypothetical protein